jgi:hypothetical protein
MSPQVRSNGQILAKNSLSRADRELRGGIVPGTNLTDLENEALKAPFSLPTVAIALLTRVNAPLCSERCLGQRMEPSRAAMIGALIAHLKPTSVAVLARAFLRSAALPGPVKRVIAERGGGRSTASQCGIWSASHYPDPTK